MLCTKICAFKSEIQQGPSYVCVVCNRCMYKKSVICFSYNSYKSLNPEIIYEVWSFDSHLYVCKTCDGKLKRTVIPCQPACNKLFNKKLPKEFQSMRRFERALVSKGFCSKK